MEKGDMVERKYSIIGAVEISHVSHVMEQPPFITADLHLELRLHAYLEGHIVKQEKLIGADQLMQLATAEVISMP